MHFIHSLMIRIDVQCIGIALLMISIVVQWNRIKLATHWNYDKHIAQCIDFALLMISIEINALHCIANDKHNYAMYWYSIAYDKHSCAMHWDCIVYDMHSCAMDWDCIAYDKHSD